MTLMIGPAMKIPTQMHSVLERDLRGETVYHRFVGEIDHGEGNDAQVGIVGEWRRSMPHAFAAFVAALAEIVAIRTRQAFDDDGRMRRLPDPIECVKCAAPLDAGRRSRLFNDCCAKCEP